MASAWINAMTYGGRSTGFIDSEYFGTLGESYKIDIWVESTAYRCKLVAKYESSETEHVIFLGDAGESGTIYWTPPLDLAEYSTDSTTVAVNFGFYVYRSEVADYYINDTPTQHGYNAGAWTTASFAIPDSVVPEIVAFDVGDETGYLETYGSYIQNESILRVELKARPAYGSPIKKMTLSTYDVSEELTPTEITDGEQVYYVVTARVQVRSCNDNYYVKLYVTDNRGRTSESRASVSVSSYSPPGAVITDLYRCDINGNASYDGKYVYCVYSYNYCSLDGKNSCNRRSRYGIADGQTYNYSTASIIYIGGDERYEFAIEISDNFNTVISTTKYIQPIAAILDICKTRNAIGLGGTAADDNTLTIGLYTKFTGGTNLVQIPYNYLDNSYFGNIIDQGYYNDNLICDRWRSGHGTDPSLFTSGSYMTVPDGEYIYQKVYIHGRIDKLTFATKDTSDNIRLATLSYSDPDGDDWFGVYYATMDAHFVNACVYIVRIPAGSYKWAALYAGEYDSSTLPPYWNKPYEDELHNCMRYVQTFKTDYMYSTDRNISLMVKELPAAVYRIGSKFYVYADLPLRAPMAVDPRTGSLVCTCTTDAFTIRYQIIKYDTSTSGTNWGELDPTDVSVNIINNNTIRFFLRCDNIQKELGYSNYYGAITIKIGAGFIIAKI